MEEKRKEKYLQTRYKRELERYLNRVVNFVQPGGFVKEAFDRFIERVDGKLAEVEKIPLYNDYFEQLERFIEMARGLRESGLESDEIRSRILHEANRIRKAKRKKSYNRRELKRPIDDEF
ncbi:hypothetical protein [Hydrogenimonas sp.]